MAEFAIMPIEDYRRACDAIREKTGGTDGITSGELEAHILSIETGVQLPVLVSPGAAEDLKYGRQMIDGEGNVVNGAMPQSIYQGHALMYPEYDRGPFRMEVYVSKGFATGDPLQTFPLIGLPYIDEFGNVRYANFMNNGATNGNLDGLNSTSVNVPEGYTEGGEITFDDTALAARIDGIQGTYSEGTLDEKFTRSENEVQTQAELLDQIEAILNGEAEGPGESEGGGSGSTEPETCKVTVWAGRTYTDLLICFPNGDRPAYVPLSGSGDVRYDVTVPKNSMIFVEKQGGNPTVQGAYRCTYTLVPLRNTSYRAVLAKITEDGAQLTID